LIAAAAAGGGGGDYSSDVKDVYRHTGLVQSHLHSTMYITLKTSTRWSGCKISIELVIVIVID